MANDWPFSTFIAQISEILWQKCQRQMSAPLFLSVFARGHSNYLSLLSSMPSGAGRGAEESEMNSFCHRPLAGLANTTASRCQIVTHPAFPFPHSFSQTLLQSSWISMMVAMFGIALALKSVLCMILSSGLNAIKLQTSHVFEMRQSGKTYLVFDINTWHGSAVG